MSIKFVPIHRTRDLLLFYGKIRDCPIKLTDWKQKQQIMISNDIKLSDSVQDIKFGIKQNTELQAVSQKYNMLYIIETLEKDKFFDIYNPNFIKFIFNKNIVLYEIINNSCVKDTVAIVQTQNVKI